MVDGERDVLFRFHGLRALHATHFTHSPSDGPLCTCGRKEGRKEGMTESDVMYNLYTYFRNINHLKREPSVPASRARVGSGSPIGLA